MSRQDFNYEPFQPNGDVPRGNRVVDQVVDITYCAPHKGDAQDEFGSILHDTNIKAHERPDACARKIIGTRNERYYIKANDKGELFDPQDRSMISEQNRKSFGRKVWQLKEVRKLAFEYYLQFLSSQNKAFLGLARRNLEC